MKKSLFILLISLCSCNKNYSTEPTVDFEDYYYKEIGKGEYSIKKLEGIDISQLKEIDKDDPVSINQKKYNEAKHYYYNIIDTSKINSVVYFYFNEGKEKSFVLENYTKDNQFISEIVISTISGDGGYFSNSEGEFINDSTIIREDKSGYYKMMKDSNAEIEDSIIESYNKLKILIRTDGIVMVDTIK
ncbi:MAG: hypothetical protein H3C39_00835 [Flavobacteriia bacterium]|nr:hypothetical protein [Flavobacteriia bacterium]